MIGLLRYDGDRSEGREVGGIWHSPKAVYTVRYMPTSKSLTIPDERIVNQIHIIRGKKVMLDRDLAELYGVTTGRLNEQVKRNKKRFPEDFMFQLNSEETANWRSQIAISKSTTMGIRRKPYAFTEHGIAMLSSVLRSDRAIQINILIIKTFIRMREMLETNQALRERIEALERKYGEHNEHIRALYQTLKKLLIQEAAPPKQIGFRRPGK